MPATGELFSEADRDAVLVQALGFLDADARVEAAVVTGSIGREQADRWSDIDLDAVIAEGVPCEDLARDWEELAYREWPVIHHYATEFGATLVRGFLLGNGLVVDLAFTPAPDFQAWAPVRVAFDRAGAVTRIAQAWRPWTPTPDWRGEAGFASHDLLHACVAANRGRLWQSLYYLQRVRNRTMALAAARHGWDPEEFVHVDDLPTDELAALLPTLVGDLEPQSLVDAIHAATVAFLSELREGDAGLADRLTPTLLAIVSSSGGDH